MCHFFDPDINSGLWSSEIKCIIWIRLWEIVQYYKLHLTTPEQLEDGILFFLLFFEKKEHHFVVICLTQSLTIGLSGVDKCHNSAQYYIQVDQLSLKN